MSKLTTKYIGLRTLTGTGLDASASAFSLAQSVGLKTGGSTVKKVDPSILAKFALIEHRSRALQCSTEENVRSSDGTLIFATASDPSVKLATIYCKRFDRPCNLIQLPLITDRHFIVEVIVQWMQRNDVRNLNVIGGQRRADYLSREVSEIFAQVLDRLQYFGQIDKYPISSEDNK